MVCPSDGDGVFPAEYLSMNPKGKGSFCDLNLVPAEIKQGVSGDLLLNRCVILFFCLEAQNSTENLCVVSGIGVVDDTLAR